MVEKDETREIIVAIKELTETLKNLPEILLTKADLPLVSLKKEETLKKIKKAKYYESCCFDCEEAEGNNEFITLFVRGFEYLRDREEIKKELKTIFRSCGEITRVFVPIECKTGVPLGFAFIDLKNGEGNDKALGLNGCYLAGGRLEVAMARDRDEMYCFYDFSGCDRCRRASYRNSDPYEW